MKILHINTYDITGGAARAAYRLHRGMIQIGEESWMLVNQKASMDDSVFSVIPKKSGNRFGDEYILRKVIQGRHIRANRTDISNTLFSLPYPGYDLSTLPLVKSVDLINLHWVADFQSTFTLNKLFAMNKPIVWTFHDQWAFTGGCHYSAGCEEYRKNCECCWQLSDDPFNLTAAILRDKQFLFKGANLTVVAPSRWMGACARKSTLFKNVPVKVIPYSLESDIFKPMPKEEAKKYLGLPPETAVLLFGAEYSVEKRKGFRELMKAIQSCMSDPVFRKRTDEDTIRILCFGHPNKALKTADIPITSLGYLKSDAEIRQAYSAADIFVLPSLEDNLPNTMLESMSCGTPVVAFNTGGFPDVIIDDVTGRLVPIGDAHQLGKAILSLMFEPDKRKIMSRNCRKAIENGYSLPMQARRYQKLYQELHGKYGVLSPGQSLGSTTKIDSKEKSVKTSTTEFKNIRLETSVGPHFQDVLDKAIINEQRVSIRYKIYRLIRHRLRRFRRI